MDVNDIYGGKHLKAEDLKGKDVELEIAGWELEEFDEGGMIQKKIVLHFHQTDKTLVLNKTNAKTIAEIHGMNPDVWKNCKVTLFPTQTDFAGKSVPCLRVRLPEVAPEKEEKEIPF